MRALVGSHMVSNDDAVCCSVASVADGVWSEMQFLIKFLTDFQFDVPIWFDKMDCTFV